MTYTVLIDGPSGSGKTTLAAQLATRLDAKVVHLDDFYPGWGGLGAASRMVASEVLAAKDAGYRRWDWERNRPGQWVRLSPEENLIVEGVGALSGASVEAARRRGGVVSVVLDLPEQVRKDRALRRDAGSDYARYWDMWAAQEREHFARWVSQGVVPDFIHTATGGGVAGSTTEKGPGTAL